jgi:hypothetical protein
MLLAGTAHTPSINRARVAYGRIYWKKLALGTSFGADCDDHGKKKQKIYIASKSASEDLHQKQSRQLLPHLTKHVQQFESSHI